MLFPEKINNKYVMLYRIPPDIWITYLDDLIHWGDHKIIMRPRGDSRESVKIGAGDPLIKTEGG